MKLSKIFTVVGVFALLSLASCKKDVCHVCTQDGFDTQTLCTDEYPGSTLGISALDIAVELQVASGYTCTKQ